MLSIPRRLRKINCSEQGAENVELNDDGLQRPPEIDNILPGIPHESTSPIKIIWPNGAVRQIVGVCRSQLLSKLNGGKIIVGTDQNGVPNERSGSILSSYLTELAQNSTIAPLHIPRWDNEMFKPKQQEMIKLVEEKFVYPPETTQLTRDWILMTLAKKWRTYKSCLKKKCYNRDTRTLDEILKDIPRGVNEHQWHTLVGIWCQDSHMKICLKNSESAKQQKNSHTTGRKGHARLLKEMEIEKNGKVSKIELWDRAHKRKDDNNESDNVNAIMDTTQVGLSKRKLDDKKSLSSKDCSEVSKCLLPKRAKLRGFYHDKYWNHVKVSQGMAFVEESEQEEMVQFKLRAFGDNLENMQDEFQMMRAFMAKKFPGEDYRNVMEATENDEVDLHERTGDTNIQHETNNDIQESPRNMNTSATTFKDAIPGKCTRIKEGHANASLPHEDLITKEPHREIYAKEHQAHVPHEQVTKQQPRTENCSKESYANSSLGRRRIIAMKANNENSMVADQGSDVSSLPHKQPANKDKFEVYLFSANPRNRDRVVAIGSLVTQDKTCVVGGNMLGDEFYAVLIKHPTPFADEKLPRPYKDIQTVRDALGHVIAWPRFHVKKKKSSSNQKNDNLVVKSGA